MPATAGPFYLRRRFETFDPDELKSVIDGTEFEHKILPGGRQYVEHRQLRLGTCTLQGGLYGMGTLAEGCFPRNRVTVGFALDAPDPIRLNGCKAELHNLQLYAESAELSYQSAPDSAWVACTIQRKNLEQASLELTGRAVSVPARGLLNLEPEPQVGARLAATICAAFEAGAELSGSQQVVTPLAAVEERLLYDIAKAVHSVQEDDRASRIARNRARQSKLMRRAGEYLQANLSEPFSLAGLAEAAGISPRTVEYHFRRTYGMTPKRWFTTMKLNRVHAELKQRGRSDTRVTDVALDWGFNHLGRFSAEYRRLFGESPSQTLRR